MARGCRLPAVRTRPHRTRTATFGGAQGEILAELERRGVREVTGYGSLARLLCETLHLPFSEAKTRAARAMALNGTRDLTTGEQPPIAPATALAAVEGAVGAAQIDKILGVLGKLPTTVSGPERDEAEKILAELARAAGPREIDKAGARLLAQLDPDGPEPKSPEPEPFRPEFSIAPHRDGGHQIKARVDDETSARLQAMLNPLAKPRPATEEGRDTRSPWERRGHAFSELVRMWAEHPDLPTQAGESTHIVVTVGLEELRTGIGQATLDPIGEITAAQARRLACDAKIIPMVLGTHSEPLDVGRAQRLATPAIRRALIHRDRGCAFPGCEAPASQCTAHHIVCWAHHGETKVDNLVLVCSIHHKVIHRSEWEVRIATDGLPEFLPPTWLDPTRTPRRNTINRT
ncbi:HNH endonuclease signature motif containing protein [Amycolatopsis samaneae]|uniref:HNH endonuclease signature motif containing protein n=1 Tax=Amycolatopsis samaneae TaxID=664691 RepID=UPI00360F835B